MKIVISPAKSLDFETKLPTQRHSIPQFLEQSEKLNKILAKKKPKALRELMSISDNLAQLNWERNQQFSTPFNPDNARPAVFAFNGDVYQGLDANSVSEDKLDALQDYFKDFIRTLRNTKASRFNATLPSGNGNTTESGSQKKSV